MQALIAIDTFMSEDIRRINDATADRARHSTHFEDIVNQDTHSRRRRFTESATIGASDARSSKQEAPTRADATPDTHRDVPDDQLTQHGASDARTQECWVRTSTYMQEPPREVFEVACRRARLNDGQRQAMFLTGKHRLVLVRGPPGTGKTQLASATTDAWAQNLEGQDIVIAAGPSNTATDNLLDRTADMKRTYKIGRLGEGESVFASKRVEYSLTALAKATVGQYAKKSRINQAVRSLILRNEHPVLFTTYMKSAELSGTRPRFILADEAGQATEPTTAVLLANAVDGGHVMIVGDEHQLAPTVKDQRAEWEGLSCSLLARLNRTHSGLEHVVMLAIQYRMHPDIQRFPNSQYYDNTLQCGLNYWPAAIRGIAWPAKGEGPDRPGSAHTGIKTDEAVPCHRVLYVHCSGEETKDGNSPSNEMQATAVEYMLDRVHYEYPADRTPRILVLTPYRGQHTILTQRLAKYGNSRLVVSTIDAAQGQEADLVIISLVRANATGKVGFTDDARRLNVAITRAKAGVVIVGHLATTLAAGTSGISALLHDLRIQAAVYRYNPETAPPLKPLPASDFDMYDQEFPAETTDARNRRKRDAQDWANLGDNPNEERAEEADIAAATRRARDQLTTLTSSKSFVLAMAHVCSLKQRIKYSNDVPPNSVEDWDRKTWSGENHFTSTGVAVDPGNFVLATMLLAIRHALGMEEHLSADGIMQAPDPKGGNRPAPWSSPPCSRHPVFTGSAAAGLARKEGCVQAIANLFRAGAPIAACLRIVIETLVQEEKPHQVSTHTHLPDNKCESLGDVLEAAGGLLSPYTPAAKKVMHSMHAAHGITAMDDADAFRSLSSLAQSIKDLTRMIPPPKAHDGSPGANRERIWAILNEVQPDDIAFETRARDAQRGCWICRELSHLGEHLLLNPNPEDGEWALEPNLREPRGNARRHNLGQTKQPGRDVTSQIARQITSQGPS